MEKALKQAQQEANTHAHATQELISAKLAVQTQVKPLSDLAEYATNSVEATIVAARGEHKEETVMKHATQAQNAVNQAKQLFYDFLGRRGRQVRCRSDGMVHLTLNTSNALAP